MCGDCQQWRRGPKSYRSIYLGLEQFPQWEPVGGGGREGFQEVIWQKRFFRFKVRVAQNVGGAQNKFCHLEILFG